MSFSFSKETKREPSDGVDKTWPSDVEYYIEMRPNF